MVRNSNQRGRPGAAKALLRPVRRHPPRGASFLLSLCLTLLCSDGLAQPARRSFTIQIAAMASEELAEAMAAEKRGLGMAAVVTHRVQPGKPVIYRIQIGRFKFREQAEDFARDLARRALIPEFYITEVDSRDILSTAGREASPLPPPPAAAKPPARADPPSRESIAEAVLPMVARSVNAAAAEIRERANRYSGMTAFRHANYGYGYYRPRVWLEGDVSPQALREEGLTSGETFVSPETGAFLSSAYRNFRSNRDGNVPVRAITPEVLVQKLMSRLRRLPGVSDAREGLHRTTVRDGVERVEMDIELSFQPAVNSPRIPFIGRAVLLRSAAGVFELLGLRQRQSPAAAIQMIDRALESAALPFQR
ncbi:MAG: SPOR domain-containing protein [Blastocatellia bacterium]